MLGCHNLYQALIALMIPLSLVSRRCGMLLMKRMELYECCCSQLTTVDKRVYCYYYGQTATLCYHLELATIVMLEAAGDAYHLRTGLL